VINKIRINIFLHRQKRSTLIVKIKVFNPEKLYLKYLIIINVFRHLKYFTQRWSNIPSDQRSHSISATHVFENHSQSLRLSKGHNFGDVPRTVQ